MKFNNNLFIYSPERFLKLKDCYEYAISLKISFMVVYCDSLGFWVKCFKDDCEGIKW